MGHTGSYDVVHEATTDFGDLAATREKITTLHEAGYTWYLDSDWHTEHEDPLGALRGRIEKGPPR